MFYKMRKNLWGRNLSLQDRTLRIVLLIGESMSTFAMIEAMYLNESKKVLILWIIFLIIVGISSVIMFKYKKTNISSIMIGITIACLIFPGTFFLSGGLSGGSTVWMCLGVIYNFLMFNGMTFFIMFGITVISYITTYYLAYEEIIQVYQLETKWSEFFDSAFSVFLVGIIIGIIVNFQAKVYKEERELTELQQEEIRQIAKSKDSFFASVSHEIRTPINTILGLNEMNLRESTSDSIRENSENIQSASELLLNLINDVIDLSQLEIKKVEIHNTEYDLKMLVKELVNMIHVKLKQKGIEFYVDIDENIPSILWGDEKRIKQVMLNILSNAAKYTSKGSVTFTVRGRKVDNKLVIITLSVKDTGIGIKKEDIPLLFEPFKRIDTQKNSAIVGTGLGLSIAKQMIDVMGGHISVDSIYTKGSTFTVTLEQGISDVQPVGKIDFFKRKQYTENEIYKHSFESPEARVLVVDDNEMNLVVVKKLLSDTKVQVDTATSGRECLELTKLKYYNVILMDHLMSEMDGVMTLKELRRQGNGLCKDVPVIVLTANVDMGINYFYRKVGFDSYLEKPIRGENLEKEILRYLPQEIIEYRRDKDIEYEDESIIRVISESRKKPILITTDNLCDIPENLLERYNIKVISLYIKTDKGRFCDKKEINTDSLSQMLTDENAFLKADSASVEEYEDFFADALTTADEVIHISMSNSIGVSCSRAIKAAKGFDHVRIIDSCHISGGQALLVLQAAKMVQDGASVKDIVNTIDGLRDDICSTYMLPHMKLYEKNGYATSAQKKIIEFFKIRPVLKMKQGKLRVSAVYFGKKENAWISYMRRYLRFHRRKNYNTLFVSYVGLTAKELEFLEKEIRKNTKFRNVYINQASVSTACNAGIGTIGFSYYIK